MSFDRRWRIAAVQPASAPENDGWWESVLNDPRAVAASIAGELIETAARARRSFYQSELSKYRCLRP
jgi:hypothetical protein